MFGWGVGFYGPSVFLNVLHESRGWPVSLISGAITCHFLLSAIIVARLPALHRRFGLMAVTRAGSIAAALGVLGWAAAIEPWQLYAAVLLRGAGWAATSGAAINAMVAPWFDRSRPAAISMAFNGSSVGGAIFTPLWALLITQLGFIPASIAIGVVMVVTLWWVAGRYLRSTPAEVGLAATGDVRPETVSAAVRSASTHNPLPLRPGIAAWRERRFATLSFAFALGLFAQIGLFAHLFSLLLPALGAAVAGLSISFVTGCAVLGRTLLGACLPANADRPIAGATNCGVQIAGSVALLLANGSSVLLLLLGCALLGLGVGNLVSLPPLIAQAEFARGDVPRVVALVTAANQAVFAFAPATLGVLRDATGGSSAVVVAVGLVQISAAVILLAGRRTLPKVTSP
jgi:MFS family permease